MKQRLIWVGFLTGLLILMGNRPILAEAANPYNITSYVVTVQVSEDNVCHVQENIEVYFNESRHGIYRDIPISYTVSRTDGSSHKVRSKVSNVSCSDDYAVSRADGNYRFKIGDEHELLTGEKNYTISYDYALGKDPLKGLDEFYYNIIGTGWDTTIQNVTFSVIMPSEIDAEKVGMSYGSDGDLLYKGLNYQIKDNLLIGSLDSSVILQPYQGITVRMELPDGYFVYRPEFPLAAVSAIVLAILAVIAAFVMWLYYGKDDPVIETIEFHPPAALNSLEVALAYKGKVDGEDVVSLLVYLAQKGYLSIQEYTSCNDFILQKTKDYDGTNQVERIFMNNLFAKGSVVQKSDLKNSFYKTIHKITGIMNSKRNRRVLFYESSMNKNWIFYLMALASMVLSLYQPLVDGGTDQLTALVISLVLGGILIVIIRALMHPGSLFAAIYIVIWSISFLGVSGVMILQTILYADFAYQISCIFCILASLVIMFFLHFMPKRTEYGTKILGYIQGFREFLLTAEKDRLEALVEEDPQYFYDILPYTYVLGVSDKWMKKFEEITVESPDWYHSSQHSAFHIVHFHQMMRQTMTMAKSSMTSSPGSGGHGGGGHAGGGHGGGGGGSW